MKGQPMTTPTHYMVRVPGRSIRDIIDAEMSIQRISGYRLGQLSGVRINTINRYRRGDRDMTGERLAAILSALGARLITRDGRVVALRGAGESREQ